MRATLALALTLSACVVDVPPLESSFACSGDRDCAEGFVCSAGLCKQSGGPVDPCNPSPCRSASATCSVVSRDPPQFTCSPCGADNECGAGKCAAHADGKNHCDPSCGPSCSTDTSRCVTVQGPDHPQVCVHCPTCTSGTCGPSGIQDPTVETALMCAPACTQDVDCVGEPGKPYCDNLTGGSHTCVECLFDSNCGSQKSCMNGTCVDPCAACDPNTQVCVATTAGLACKPNCPMPDSACGPGWCTQVSGVNGAPMNACISCTTACSGGTFCYAPPVDPTSGALWSTADAARAAASCACADRAQGWYSLLSACDLGVSNAASAGEAPLDAPDAVHLGFSPPSTPVVSWSRQDNSGIEVRSFKTNPSASWVTEGGGHACRTGTGACTNLLPGHALAAEPGGVHLMWIELDAAGTVNQAYWAQKGATWVAEGNSSNSGEGVSATAASVTRVAASANGNRRLAVWRQGGLMARYLDASSNWQYLGGDGTSATGNISGSTPINPSISPRTLIDGSYDWAYAAFQDTSGSIFVRYVPFSTPTTYWNNARSIAPGEIWNTNSNGFDLGLAGIAPVVVWSDASNGIKLAQLPSANGNWQGFATSTAYDTVTAATSSFAPSLAFYNGLPIVAYADSGNKIWVRRFISGSGYVVVGDASVPVTDNGAYPQVAVGYRPWDPASFMVCVAWLERSLNPPQLLLRCHDLP